MKDHLMGTHGPGRDEETNSLSSRQCVAKHVEMYVRCSEKESETMMGYRESKARQCLTIEGIFFIEPNDEELFKLTVKPARGKLEVPMTAAMLCKVPIKSSRETQTIIWKRKIKYACVVDVDESTRPRLEGAGHKPHQDQITAKWMNFKNSSQLTKVGNKKEVIDEARNKGRKVHLASLMDLCHLQNSELDLQYQKYKAAKVINIKSRLPGFSRQAADAVSAYTQVKNGGCSRIIENSQIGVSRHLDSSTTTQMA